MHIKNPVLLLDPAWRIDRVIRAERAVELIVTDRVVTASEEIAAVFHSPSITVEVPSVIACTHGIVLPHRGVACSHRRVRVRDRHVCQFVVDGAPCDRRGDSVDHLVPSSRGGPSAWSNLVAACRSHNNRKADSTFDEMRERHGWALRRAPFEPTREDIIVAGLRGTQPGWEPFLRLA